MPALLSRPSPHTCTGILTTPHVAQCLPSCALVYTALLRAAGRPAPIRRRALQDLPLLGAAARALRGGRRRVRAGPAPARRRRRVHELALLAVGRARRRRARLLRLGARVRRVAAAPGAPPRVSALLAQSAASLLLPALCALTDEAVAWRAKSNQCSTDCLAPKDAFGGQISCPRRRARVQREPHVPTGGGCWVHERWCSPTTGTRYLPITRHAWVDRHQAASCAHQAPGSSQGACSATLSSGAPPAAASSAASRVARSRNSPARAGAAHLSSHARSQSCM